MNPFWVRAEREHRLKSMFVVLVRELNEEAERKCVEVSKFVTLSGDPEKLAKYKTDSGLTQEVCERILQEVRDDLEKCVGLGSEHSGLDAVDGEKDLKTLYRKASDVCVEWKAKDGQKPVDLLVVRQNDASVLGCDCKFGLKSDDSWIIRNESQFKKEFSDKFSAIGCVLKANESIDMRPEMLLIATSALAPLLKNRIEDFKLDPKYASIPYDRVRVCSVEDIYDSCKEILEW